MHTVKARPITVADVEVGRKILHAHGVGYVDAEVVNVRTKERVRREGGDRGPVVETGTETHFGIRSATGYETGGAFYPAFLPPQSRGSDPGLSFLVPDEDGEIEAPVLDYIGCVTRGIGLNVFIRDETDPEVAAKRVREALGDAGLEVIGDAVTCVPVTEQRVVIYDIGNDSPRGVCFEHESSTISKRSAYRTDYLPVGAQ
jgi:hypothetical protein